MSADNIHPSLSQNTVAFYNRMQKIDQSVQVHPENRHAQRAH